MFESVTSTLLGLLLIAPADTSYPARDIADDQLVGTFDFPGLNTTYEWNFTR